jgi:hypothetical protein
MAYVAAAMAIYGGVTAYTKGQEAKKDIAKLSKWNPKFKDALTIQREAEAAVRNGYSPEEVANFQQGLTRSNNASYRRATDINPNLAPAIQAGINYGNVAAQNQFTAADAQLRQAKVDRLGNQITAQDNAQTQADIQSKREQEIAYGNAKNQNDADLYNSIAMGLYSTKQAGLFDGSKTTPPPSGGSVSSIPTTPNQMGNAVNYGLVNPYQRQAAPTYPNYQPGYDPYNSAGIFRNQTKVPFYQNQF